MKNHPDENRDPEVVKGLGKKGGWIPAGVYPVHGEPFRVNPYLIRGGNDGRV
jgi:hypothetical protein